MATMLRSEQETVRRIVREEIAAAFRVLADSARILDVYDTDHIESVALTAVAQSADRSATSVDRTPTEETPDGT
jgi:hypothetical protein